MREITRELHNAEAEMAVRCINGEGCTAGRVRQYPRKVLHYLEGYWLWCMPQRMVDARNWFHDGLIGNSELYMYTYIHVYKNNLYWTPVSVCILSLLRYLAPQALNMELQGAVPWMLMQPSHGDCAGQAAGPAQICRDCAGQAAGPAWICIDCAGQAAGPA